MGLTNILCIVIKYCISIGNRTISSTIWKLIDTSNVLKVLVIARADRRVQFKNFQNITSVYSKLSEKIVRFFVYSSLNKISVKNAKR